MFLDEALVEFASGRGGNGSASFHREKHVPRGGPNGADGGRGGDVVLIADRHKRTLYDFKLHRRYRAENGEDAVGNKTGKDGRDAEVLVPVGTIVTDSETGDILADLNVDGMRYVLCRGGKGGFGNLHYVSSVRQVPSFAQKGAPAEEVIARLELKLLADVGLVGLPNAGKSTLIGRISASKAKIADYPFTTIEPNLGVVSHRDETFTVADMPGLIEGASEGHGLGHQFLKHVERTRVLVHVIDAYPIDGSDAIANYRLVEEELRKYSQTIYDRPRVLALNKVDVLGSPEDVATMLEMVREGVANRDRPTEIYPISAVTGEGIQELLDEIIRLLRETEGTSMPTVVPVMRAPEDLNWDVEVEEDGFVITGKRIERMVAMTDLKNEEAVRYLHRRFKRLGVIERLRDMGAEEGDAVRVGDVEFAYTDQA